MWHLDHVRGELLAHQAGQGFRVSISCLLAFLVRYTRFSVSWFVFNGGQDLFKGFWDFGLWGFGLGLRVSEASVNHSDQAMR